MQLLLRYADEAVIRTDVEIPIRSRERSNVR